MSFYVLEQVTKDTYDRITRNYFKFIAASDNPAKAPVQVYSPLNEKLQAELQLIRDVSRDLQLKKEQDKKTEEEVENENEEKSEENEATENSEPVSEETELTTEEKK